MPSRSLANSCQRMLCSDLGAPLGKIPPPPCWSITPIEWAARSPCPRVFVNKQLRSFLPCRIRRPTALSLPTFGRPRRFFFFFFFFFFFLFIFFFFVFFFFFFSNGRTVPVSSFLSRHSLLHELSGFSAGRRSLCPTPAKVTLISLPLIQTFAPYGRVSVPDLC